MPADEPPVLEVTVAAPVDVVWDALRDRDQLRRWHGWLADGLDDEIELIFHGDAVADEGEHTLQLVGEGGAEVGDRFELTDAGAEGTRVRIVRGPRPPVESDWAAHYDDVTEGWTSFLQQLRFAVERQPRVERRTVFVSASKPGEGSLREAAGVAGSAALVVPLQSDGEPWFVSEHQAGAVVPALGPGLVIAAEGTGKEMVIVSAYGLDDAAMDRLVARVGRWWSERHPQADPPSV